MVAPTNEAAQNSVLELIDVRIQLRDMSTEAMMKKLFGLAPVLALVISCSGNDSSEETSAETQAQVTTEQEGKQLRLASRADSVAGISWRLPMEWEEQGDRSMRVATYSVPHGSRDSVDAECAVFFFGSDQGGSIDANIDRWLSQVSQADGSPTRARMKQSQFETGCCEVTVVDIPGTYQSGGMGMQPEVDHEGWVLLGGIIEAPDGNVFFKLTGPEATVYAHRAQFIAMVKSTKEVGS
jgi:hypothetical protein